MYSRAILEAIAKIDDALMRYAQHSAMSLRQYSKALVTKPASCEEVFDEFVQKGIFIERITGPSVSVSPHTEGRTQRKPCTTWLFTRHHCKLYKRKMTCILRKGQIKAEILRAAV